MTTRGSYSFSPLSREDASPGFYPPCVHAAYCREAADNRPASALAASSPTQAGYEITPRLPMSTFEPRFPQIGVAQQQGLIRGYLTTSGGSLTMRVAPPPGVSASRAVACVGTRQVPTSAVGGLVQFTLNASAGRVTDWAVSGH